MKEGMEIDIATWIRILDNMELSHRVGADSGYDALTRFLQEGYELNYALWTEQVQQYGISGFIFVLKKEDQEKRCKVAYGIQSSKYISKNHGDLKLYFRRKISLEEEFYSEQDSYWRAGL